MPWLGCWMLFSHSEIPGSAPFYCVEFLGYVLLPALRFFPGNISRSHHTNLSRSTGTAGPFGAAVPVLSHPIPQKKKKVLFFKFFSWLDRPSGPSLPVWGSLLTLRHTTLGMNPLDEWSASRRDICLAAHNTHKRQTSVPPAGFEPALPASERPQTHTFDLRSACLVIRPV